MRHFTNKCQESKCSHCKVENSEKLVQIVENLIVYLLLYFFFLDILTKILFYLEVKVLKRIFIFCWHLSGTLKIFNSIFFATYRIIIDLNIFIFCPENLMNHLLLLAALCRLFGIFYIHHVWIKMFFISSFWIWMPFCRVL